MMSTKYKKQSEVPTEIIVNRLSELSNACKSRESRDREFTMRIPAELDRDPDLVLSIAANRLDQLQSQLVEVQREGDELKAGYAFIGDFELPPTVTEQIKDAIEKGKRREWVRTIDAFSESLIWDGKFSKSEVRKLSREYISKVENGGLQL